MNDWFTIEQIDKKTYIMVIDRCDLPEGYHVDTYDFFQGTPNSQITYFTVLIKNLLLGRVGIRERR